MELPVISTLGPAGYANAARAWLAAAPAGTQNWPSADLAIYVPIVIRYPFTVKVLWWANGGTTNGNVDCGIYSSAGSKLTSTGTTAQAGNNAIQSAAPSGGDYLLAIGTYYLGLALSSGTGQVQRATPGINGMIMWGCAQEASATTLPTTMTPATIAQDYLPLFGASSRTLI